MVDLPVLFDFLSQTEQRDEKRPATLLHLLLQHSTCLWHSSSPTVTSSPDLRSRKQHMTRTLAIFRKNAFHLFLCAFRVLFLKKLTSPKCCCEGVLLPLVFSSQLSVNRTLVLLPPKRESGLLRKALRYRLCFSCLIFFLFFTLLHQPGTP